MSDRQSNKVRKGEQKRHYHAEFKTHVKPRHRPWTYKHHDPATMKKK